MFTCSLGSPTLLNQVKQSERECSCEESCEIHFHREWGVECMHGDTVPGHSHCPQNILVAPAPRKSKMVTVICKECDGEIFRQAWMVEDKFGEHGPYCEKCARKITEENNK